MKKVKFDLQILFILIGFDFLSKALAIVLLKSPGVILPGIHLVLTYNKGRYGTLATDVGITIGSEILFIAALSVVFSAAFVLSYFKLRKIFKVLILNAVYLFFCFSMGSYFTELDVPNTLYTPVSIIRAIMTIGLFYSIYLFTQNRIIQISCIIASAASIGNGFICKWPEYWGIDFIYVNIFDEYLHLAVFNLSDIYLYIFVLFLSFGIMSIPVVSLLRKQRLR